MQLDRHQIKLLLNIVRTHLNSLEEAELLGIAVGYDYYEIIHIERLLKEALNEEIAR